MQIFRSLQFRRHIERPDLRAVKPKYIITEVLHKLNGADGDNVLNAPGLSGYGCLEACFPVALVEMDDIDVTGRVEPVVLVDSFLKNDSFGGKLSHLGLKIKCYHKIFLLFVLAGMVCGEAENHHGILSF